MSHTREIERALRVLRWQPSDGKSFRGVAVAPMQPMRPLARVVKIGYASVKGNKETVWEHVFDEDAQPYIARGDGKGVFSPVYRPGEPWLLLGRLVDMVIERDGKLERALFPPLSLATTADCESKAGGPLILVAEGGTEYALCPMWSDRRRRYCPFVTGRGIEG